MKAGPVPRLDPAAPTREGAAKVVRVRLEELRSLAGPALDPAAASAQHEMRIAAKRLRYTLEITAGCLGEEAAIAQRAAKELQGVLGDIHDCDVMRPRVAGIESVLSLLRTRRELLLRRFQELWREQERRGIWADLEARL